MSDTTQVSSGSLDTFVQRLVAGYALFSTSASR